MARLRSGRLWLYRFVALGLVLGLLVGCGAPQTAPTAGPAATGGTQATVAAPTTAPVTEKKLSGEITVLVWNITPEMDKVLQDQAAEFEKTHPGTKVNVTLVPFDQFNTKLTLLMSSGTPPDLAAMPGDIMNYVQQGLVVPLDEFFNADPVLSDPAKSRTEAYDLVRFDGSHIYVAQYGPLCGMQLYYNKDLFDKASVEYPNENWTWDDFRAAAQELTITEGDETVQWGCDLGFLVGWNGGWDPLVWGRGGQLYDTNFNPEKLTLNTPEVIDALQWMQDLIYKDKVAPSPAVQSVLSQAGGPFLSGKVAMVIDGCWMLSAYKGASFPIGMTVIPKGPKGRFQTLWYAAQLVMFQGSKNKDLAWEFARWLAVDRTANEMMASSGQNCGAPIVREFDELYSSAWKDVPGGDACVKCLEGGRNGSLWTPNWNEIWDTIINPEWEKFMNGTITAQELVTTIEPRINAKIAEQ